MKQKSETSKINEDTYLIDINHGGIPKTTSIFVVQGEKTALIDGGTSFEAEGSIKSLKDFNLFPLDYIVISHAHSDHYQGVPAFLEAMSSKKVEVLAHPNAISILEDPSKVGYDFGMGPILPIEGVNPIRGGDVLDLGGIKLEVLDTFGHSLDAISLFDSKNKNLFVSDAVGYKFDEKKPCLPSIMPPSFNPDKYFVTLDMLKNIDFESICLGHFGMFYGSDVKEILDEVKAMFRLMWKLFDDNVDRLDDVYWIKTTLIEPNFTPEEIAIVGQEDLLKSMIWMIDGYKMYRKL